MTLTHLLIAAAMLGLVWAMWVQVRAMDEDSATFRRKRRRAAIVLAVLLLAIGIVQAVATGRLRPRLFVPEEDGSWGFVSIDGQPVPNGAYTIGVTDQKLSGGRDDCNLLELQRDAARRSGRTHDRDHPRRLPRGRLGTRGLLGARHRAGPPDDAPSARLAADLGARPRGHAAPLRVEAGAAAGGDVRDGAAGVRHAARAGRPRAAACRRGRAVNPADQAHAIRVGVSRREREAGRRVPGS